MGIRNVRSALFIACFFGFIQPSLALPPLDTPYQLLESFDFSAAEDARGWAIDGGSWFVDGKTFKVTAPATSSIGFPSRFCVSSSASQRRSKARREFDRVCPAPYHPRPSSSCRDPPCCALSSLLGSALPASRPRLQRWRCDDSRWHCGTATIPRSPSWAGWNITKPSPRHRAARCSSFHHLPSAVRKVHRARVIRAGSKNTTTPPKQSCPPGTQLSEMR